MEYPEGVDVSSQRCQVTRDTIVAAAEQITEPLRAKLLKGLEKIVPSDTAGRPRGPIRLRDTKYNSITDWCQSCGLPEWGRRPRTLIILLMMGQPQAIDGFVAEGLLDIALPYTSENLPRVLTGRYRALFLDFQQHVLTPHAKYIERPHSLHQNVEGNADRFFWLNRELGHGGFGVVDEVTSRLSLKRFARKRMPRGRSFARDRRQLQAFENEITSLKSLAHRHIVKLIGSYTDRHFVGFLMQPVADMDLDAYLASTKIDLNEKKDRLRRYFGCLATAVEYLHEKGVRHKDIKPKNILIYNRQVLLTDFGTSHNWNDDGRATTEGTYKQAITKRYCAPEVASHGSRSFSSDIWSLGCVFLEMRTVLSEFSVEDMRHFLKSHGSGGDFVRDNTVGADLWMRELELQPTCSDDPQLLQLVRQMCRLNPDERPLAPETVSYILDMEGKSYYGICCNRNDLSRAGDTTGNGEDTITCDDTMTHEDTTLSFIPELEFASPHTADREPFPAMSNSVYKAPYVEDGTVTVLVEVPQQPVNNQKSQPDGEDPGDCVTPTELSHTTNSTAEGSPDMVTSHPASGVDGTPRDEDISHHFQCFWPGCTFVAEASQGNAGGQSRVRGHLRSEHGTHDFGYSTLRGDDPGPHMDTTASPGRFPSSNIALEMLPVTITGQSAEVSDPYMDTLLRKRDELKSLFRDRASSGHGTNDDGAVEVANTSTARRVRFDLSADRTRSFSPMHTDKSERPTQNTSTKLFAIDHLGQSHQKLLWHLTDGDRATTTAKVKERVLPNASLVPSLYLASCNIFAETQLRSMFSQTWATGNALPVFVYGSFMFPAVLSAIASHFSSEAGVYSEELQRRLQTDSEDWAGMNKSLEDAAAQMAPATLRNYSRWRAPDFNCASAAVTYGSEVAGYLLFGLSHEAVLCLEYMLTSKEYSSLFWERSPAYEIQPSTPQSKIGKARRGEQRYSQVTERWPSWLSFTKQTVMVDIPTEDGTVIAMEADTFLAQNTDTRDWEPWDIHRFARCRSFRKLSFDIDWSREEESLAKDIGVRHLLPGDVLRDAIMSDDGERILALMHQGHDANATCGTYGNALTAAAFKGNADTLSLLLDSGANPNCDGGDYGSPLIAATVQGNEECACLLLRRKVDVLADGGRHISAIYQAVNFSDLALAKILLEKGAWLTPSYQELMDLAAERDNLEMQQLLRKYDVKSLHLNSARSRSRSRNNDLPSLSHTTWTQSRSPPQPASAGTLTDTIVNGILKDPGPILKTLVLQTLVLKGQRGKWTGIKGVTVLREAIKAGMPDGVVDRLAPHLGDAGDILEWLKMSLNDYNQESTQPNDQRRHTISEGVGDAPQSDREQQHDRRYSESDTPSPLQGHRSDPYRSRRRHENTSSGHRGSSSSLPTYSSLDLQQPLGVGDRSGIVCISCDGHGGRPGTGIQCQTCHGKRKVRRRSSSSRSRDRVVTICPGCVGKGVVYSSRDVCRDCSGTGGLGPMAQGTIPEEPPPPYEDGR
ncbi:uncharacterized protein HMPREF1541_06570 [Cyphellophora europaea CBS 101466]|uniref:non-specific serine/threonine protein kinase n=1 Tax=Cyphellophora europaea (strain CBS 101466) TaxID=1220924 RepID=W2RS48_CYPE1|nr:uncharacterized protein HMPREF1541_06570 [Cyphellophora europaea CBS 101466]ETN38534.1 hypothetical protein HMPREF1541_06570 [Cyphellophora europaea CBS 101466]